MVSPTIHRTPSRPGRYVEEPRRQDNGADFDFSINGLLINPFRGKEQPEMEILTEKFLDICNIDEIYAELFRKGAFLAQDPAAFDNERDDGLVLKKEEKQALMMEEHHRWTQPFILYALVACCSLGAAVQGWDETAVNQAQIFYETTLGVGGDFNNPSTLLGLLNSAPYLCCAVIGCWLTDPLNKLLGRRGTIFVSCFIASVTCLGQAFAQNWQQMFVARFLLGLGMGPKSSTVPIYAAECAPKKTRGAIVMMWQTWTAFGIMLGYISGVVFQDVVGDLKWRLIIGSPMVLPLFVMAYVYVLPESPRWLLEKARKSKDPHTKRYQEAFEGLTQLRGSRLMAARDTFLIFHTLLEEEKIKQQRNRFVEMFTVKRNRTALTAGVIVMFFQQFCGVNVLAYYSSLIFQKSGFGKNDALLASMGFGIINFVFALPAVPIIDTFGRRNLLLATFPFMAIFQLFTGLGFLAKGVTRKALVTTGMYLFSVAYSPGEGPVPFTYSSECMPLYVRDLSMSLFTAVLWGFNFLLAITFPPFLNSFGIEGTFAYYAAWCVVGWFAILLLVPETGHGQTLEELDARFSIPSKTFAIHGLRQAMYWLRHGVFRQRMARPRLDIADVPIDMPVREMREGVGGGMRRRGAGDGAGGRAAPARGPRAIQHGSEMRGLAIVGDDARGGDRV